MTQKAIQTAILYATGFDYARDPEVPVYKHETFEGLQIEMIKAVNKGEYKIMKQSDPESFKDCANVLGYLVYF